MFEGIIYDRHQDHGSEEVTFFRKVFDSVTIVYQRMRRKLTPLRGLKEAYLRLEEHTILPVSIERLSTSERMVNMLSESFSLLDFLEGSTWDCSEDND